MGNVCRCAYLRVKVVGQGYQIGMRLATAHGVACWPCKAGMVLVFRTADSFLALLPDR